MSGQVYEGYLKKESIKSEAINDASMAQAVSRVTVLRRSIGKWGIAIALLFLIAIGAVLSPVFLMPMNLINVVRQVAINGILATGMMFVILTGGIDLSVGSILGVAGIVAASLLPDSGILMAIVAALLCGLVLGMANGIIIAKFRVEPFVMTLAMMTVARGIAFTLSRAQPIDVMDDTFAAIGNGSLMRIPIPVILWAIVVIVSALVLKYTPFGRYVYAIGGNEEATRLSGVNVDTHKIVVYIISGVFAALAGIVLTARITTGLAASGTGYELDAIAAVVIGGTALAGGEGSITGTVIGVLLIGVLNNLLNLLNVSPWTQQIVKGLIIVGAVLLRRRSRRG